MGLTDWLLKIAITKGGKRAVIAGVGFLTALLSRPNIADTLTRIGVSVDFEKLQTESVVLLGGLITWGLEIVVNWAKHKKGFKFL